MQVQQQQGLLKVMLNAEQAPRALITIALIHTILQKLQLRCLHTVKIYGLRAQHQVLWSKTFSAPGQEIVPQSISRFAYDRFEINVLALPCAFTLAGLLQFTGLIHLLEFPFLFWMHFMGELGILLLGSRLILLPQLMGSSPPAPSLILYPLVFALLAFLFFNSRRENLRWSMGLAVGLISLQGLFTFGLSDSAFAVWAGLGGLCGEFLLSTLILINFYHRFPDHLRWDFWRYPFLLLAACGFWQNLKLWWGSFPGTPASELMGTWSVLDLEWLTAQLQWSFSDILQFCQGVFLICSLLVLGFYVYFALKTEPDQRYALQQQLICWWVRRQARQQR
ncbi:MAG: hypothetical protein HC921_19625 [Synechococcaceae cyanobacterium SM2_3_1]|nr:hypothetical protein [Synechococcaceae cyanobacterium SM2_3_1]